MFIKKLFLVTMLLLPAIASAQDKIPLPNPLQAETVSEFAGQVIRGLLGITGAIALFMLVFGGMTWMTSQGNAKRVEDGKNTILWAILGLVIIFMSYIVINFIFTLIGGNG